VARNKELLKVFVEARSIMQLCYTKKVKILFSKNFSKTQNNLIV
jgi:hypothetical protein